MRSENSVLVVLQALDAGGKDGTSVPLRERDLRRQSGVSHQ
jgi:hypothetical protein